MIEKLQHSTFTHETYISREKRDSRYKALRASGLNVRRRTTGQCLLHPMYVTDFDGPEKDDTGLGNTVYKTFFANLYVVELKPYWMD